MTTSLSVGSLRVLHEMWAGRLDVSPSVFEEEQTLFRSWPGASAAVVVRVGFTVVIGAPEHLLTPLRELPPPQLLEPDSLMAALADHTPQLLGPARLAYADARSLSLGTTSTVRRASRAELAPVLAASPDEDRGESGLEEMERWWIADGRDGEPTAAAGYETWGDRIAQLGILVTPGHRGHGYGASAASAAIEHALSVGLIPQWRSAAGNNASQRLGRRLGFVPHGEQIALIFPE